MTQIFSSRLLASIDLDYEGPDGTRSFEVSAQVDGCSYALHAERRRGKDQWSLTISVTTPKLSKPAETMVLVQGDQLFVTASKIIEDFAKRYTAKFNYELRWYVAMDELYEDLKTTLKDFPEYLSQVASRS